MIAFGAYAETYEAPESQWRDYEPDPICDDFGTLYGLREARDFLRATGGAHSCGITAIEPNCSDWNRAEWITAYGSMDYISGETEHRVICFPHSLTPSTRARVCRAIIGG